VGANKGERGRRGGGREKRGEGGREKKGRGRRGWGRKSIHSGAEMYKAGRGGGEREEILTLPSWCRDVKGWERSVADKLADKLARPQRNRAISCERGGGGGT